MDPEFFDLHRSVAIEPTDVQLEARTVAIATLCAGVDADAVVSLIRLAHSKPISKEIHDWFWKPFKDTDATFPIREADLLHGLMAVQCLRELIRSDKGAVSDLSALLVRLAELLGWGPVQPEMLRSVARTYLSHHEQRGPAPRPVAPTVSPIWNAKIAEQVKVAFPKPDEPATTEDPCAAIGIVATAADAQLKALATSQRAIAEWVGEEIARVDEQLGILTWLLSGARADGSAWSTLAPPQLAIDAGLELAARLARVPGPPEAEAMLAQVIGFSQESAAAPEVTIAAAANGTASPRAEPPEQLADLVPVHMVRASNALTGAERSRKWSAVNLGRLSYLEAMTINAWHRCMGDST
jgi:hypothetical protein